MFEGKGQAYAWTSERVNRLTNALIKLGVEKGDRVAILQVNCPEYVESYYAAAKLGAIFVPLNFRAKSDELSDMLGNAEAKILFVGKRYLDMVRAMLPHLSTIRQCISIDSEESDMLYYNDLISSSPGDEVFTEVGDEDITILMYTAGTTGHPKGVPLRHNAFVSYVLDSVDPASPDIDERNLLAVPLYHVAGIQAMLAAIYGGRTLVLMRQFEVKEWLETVQREQITRSMLVLTMLKIIIDDPDFAKYDLRSLRVITYGAAPMRYEVLSKAIEVMPWVRFINAFGQTETASTIITLGPEDHTIAGTEEEKEKKLKRLTSSVGKPLPGVEIKIIDEEESVLSPFEVGEIVAKGPQVMTGYWQDEQRTAEAFTTDRWLRTGDMGWMDEEGYIFLAGRSDDMIIRGGENISPDEVEDILNSHPQIEEAAVIGVPDPLWGQQPIAIVVLKKGKVATAEEIMDYCESKLASFKRPRSVVFTDSLPRNPIGKVLRKALRKQYGQP